MALVNSCPNTTQLHFTVLNRHPDEFWAILRTVTMAMPALESLYLSMEDALRLVPVCQMINDMPSLKVLELYSVAPTYPQFPLSVFKARPCLRLLFVL